MGFGKPDQFLPSAFPYKVYVIWNFSICRNALFRRSAMVMMLCSRQRREKNLCQSRNMSGYFGMQ